MSLLCSKNFKQCSELLYLQLYLRYKVFKEKHGL